MNQNVKGFGARGWILMIYQFLAYIAFVCFTNWPMNALGSYYDPVNGTQGVAKIYTIAAVLGVVIQVIASPFIGKIKSIYRLSIVMGIISIAASFGVMMCTPGTLWNVCYFVACLVVIVWSTFIVGILIGQWFPRRKGTVMGLVTIAFPVGNALMGIFLGEAIGMSMGMAAEGAPMEAMIAAIAPVARKAYMPFFILVVVGVVLAILLLKDFPEMVGAYRDNDKSMTPEMAQAMTKFEMENRKTSVWGLGHTLACPDFWLIAIPAGFMLMGSVGMMTQTTNIFTSVGIDPTSAKFDMVLMVNSVIAIFGSWILGVVDTKIGCRKSMIIAVISMIIAGVVGATGSQIGVIAGMWILGIFMGASSNYTVSGSVQYWRIEDFPTVFGKVNPLANLMNNMAPVVIASLMFMNAAKTQGMPDTGPCFIFLAVAGVVSLIMLLLFKPARVKKYDDKYRAAAGKPLDDALVGRK